MNKILLDCSVAADYLGVSIKTIRRWAQVGKLQGVKVGSRGDWRFSYDELNKMIHHEAHFDVYEPTAVYLQKNAAKITKEATILHAKELKLSEVRLGKIKQTHQLSTKLVKTVGQNLHSVQKGKLAFEKLSVNIAEEALKQGLTIEETIDGAMFLKRVILRSLENTNLFFSLEPTEVYRLMRTISLYNDIVISQIAFAYHNRYTKNQEALRQSEEKFSKVFELGPVAYTITSFSSEKLVNANEKFLKLSGYNAQELNGKTFPEIGLIADEESETAYYQRRAMLKKTGYLSKYYLSLKTKSGAVKQVHCSSVLVKINGEDHSITFYLDTTDRQRAQKEKIQYHELSLAHDELMKVSRAKDQFIGIASHQLRTPATAVKQYLGMVLSDMAGAVPDKQRKYLETAYQSNERQLKLINDLLKTAQMDASTYKLQRKMHSVSKVLLSSIEGIQPTIKRLKQRIVLSDTTENLKANIDPVEIDLVFSNLLDNASKYSPEKSRIFVSLSRRNHYVEIEIRDEGVGIEAENHTKIFDKFTRVINNMSTPENGTGIGLYWVKHIVEMHGGKIMVESKQNSGSSFKIWLPL